MAGPSNSAHHNAGSFEENDTGDHTGHFSNGDYDWMGVLDGCFGHPSEGTDEYGAGSPLGGGGGSHGGTGHAAAASSVYEMGGGHIGSAAALMAPDHSIISPTEASEIVERSLAQAQTAQSALAQTAQPAEVPVKEVAYKKAPSMSSRASSMNEDEDEAKRSDRVERKRNREKQRRLDTNSQFNTLAAIVREIETTDFMEESQVNSLFEVPPEKLKPGEATIDASPEGDEGNKRLKSDSSNPLLSGGSIQCAISAAGTYTAANRVELIARTSLMLNQFRTIRKRKNEELRDAKRQNCEMRKEIEDLRRMVAHYKTMGMGQQKPQDKIMMMVPMMVPQDAVNSISAGFPAAHTYGSFAAPWIPSPSVAHTNTPYQQPNHAAQAQGATAAPFAQLPMNQGALNAAFQYSMQNMQQAPGQAQGVASLPHHQIMQPQVFPFQVPGMAQAAIGSTGHNSASPATNQSTAQQFPQMSAPAQSMTPSLAQGMMPPAAFGQNAMAMMYPHTAPGVGAPHGLNPNMRTTPATSTTQQTSQQQPSSDKPSPSAHQGGGGNLAHCA